MKRTKFGRWAVIVFVVCTIASMILLYFVPAIQSTPQ